MDREQSDVPKNLAVAVINPNVNKYAKENVVETYEKQLKFVKKGLKLTDDEISKKKVQDLPNLMKKAQESMTIGGMGELLKDDYKKPNGFLKGIVRFFERAISKISFKRKQRYY